MAKKRTSKKKGGDRAFMVENRKARHNYEIIDTLEVGTKLAGSETKAIRDGQVSIGEGYVRATDEPVALQLYAMNIGEYGPAGRIQHKAVRPRTLLAHKKEIQKLARSSQAKGTTIVPLKLYFKEGLIKVMIGVGLGKTRTDKRHAIAKKDAARDIERAMSKRIRRVTAQRLTHKSDA